MPQRTRFLANDTEIIRPRRGGAARRHAGRFLLDSRNLRHTTQQLAVGLLASSAASGPAPRRAGRFPPDTRTPRHTTQQLAVGLLASSAASAPATASAAPTPKSDEDQVRDTVYAFLDAYNTQNWDAYM